MYHQGFIIEFLSIAPEPLWIECERQRVLLDP
jgi:hypothetical protein